MQKITLVNPHEGVAWNEHLRWLMGHRGSIAWAIYCGEQLVEYLNAFVAHRVQYKGTLMNSGMTLDEANLHLMSKLLQQFDSHHDNSVTQEQEEEILRFVSGLEPQTYEVEV